MTSHLKNRTDRQKAESTKCKELVFQKIGRKQKI